MVYAVIRKFKIRDIFMLLLSFVDTHLKDGTFLPCVFEDSCFYTDVDGDAVWG